MIERIAAGIAMLAAGAALIGASAGWGGRAAKPREGGEFRIVLDAIDYVDPALAYDLRSWSLIDTTCARLLSYPDKPPPQGFRLQHEVAKRYRVTNDGKTFTFTLRRGFRFSNGAPVTARAFSRAIARTLDPGVESPGAAYTRDIDRVVAKGYRLVVTLKHPTPDFPAQTTMPFYCAVPPNLPVDAEGVGAPFHSAGPYYVAEYVPGRRVLLKRNRFYRGKRPHHVASFRVDLRDTGDLVSQIEQGRADWSMSLTVLGQAPRLAAKYSINKSQFFLTTGLASRQFAFNTSRGIFRDNPSLRRAVNFAIDRQALRREVGGRLTARLTDQILPPGIPGYRDAHIYPLDRPNFRTAKALAKGHTRNRKVVLYVQDNLIRRAHAQILTQNLAKIGLDVDTRPIPPDAYSHLIETPGEPWDIAAASWAPDYVDPYDYLNTQLDGRFIARGLNWSRFNSPEYNRLLRRAARLRGKARERAYGKLDVRLARKAAPLLPTFFTKEATFVSKRVDPRCVVLRPSLDLTAVCLKR